ncbi:MAG: tetratricopeptide repeat protein [Candidatus Omnitrophica bacterium]|nr:tetratricopeptide repeat protein [Candidatus Omnitrophota bacterium]
MKTKIYWVTTIILLIFPIFSFCQNSFKVEEGLARYNEAVRAQKAGDFVTAKAHYQKTMMLLGGERPDIMKAVYNNMGVLQARMGNTQAAEAAFHAALAIDPDYKEANFNIGVFYGQLGDIEKALFYLTKILNRTGDFVIDGEKKE